MSLHSCLLCYYTIQLEAPEYFTHCTVYPQRNNVQVKIYAVVLGEVPGRLKRRPYNFSFYVVPLWINSANNFVLLLRRVTFVNRHKSNPSGADGCKKQELFNHRGTT